MFKEMKKLAMLTLGEENPEKREHLEQRWEGWDVF